MQYESYRNMKLCMFFSIFCIFQVLLNCTQTLYKYIPEHCEESYINESLIHFDVQKCYKLSRTELYLNSSFYFKNDILNDKIGQILISGYKFRSNEYRDGPYQFMLGMCSGFESKDYDIPNMYALSNLHCPLIKGRNYYVYKLAPNATNMPPLLPAGRWMVQVDYMYMNQYIMSSLKWFATIEYPIPIPDF